MHNQCRIDLKVGEAENASTYGKGKVDIWPDDHSGQDLVGDTSDLKYVDYDHEPTEIHKCWKEHAMELLINQSIHMISDVQIPKLSIHRLGYTYHRYLFILTY